MTTVLQSRLAAPASKMQANDAEVPLVTTSIVPTIWATGPIVMKAAQQRDGRDLCNCTHDGRCWSMREGLLRYPMLLQLREGTTGEDAS
jgi:hypothetical protein